MDAPSLIACRWIATTEQGGRRMAAMINENWISDAACRAGQKGLKLDSCEGFAQDELRIIFNSV